MKPTGRSYLATELSTPIPNQSPSLPPQAYPLPPIQGSLPFTKDDYEKLPQNQKTPALNFFILGKIPLGGGRGSEYIQTLYPDFAGVVQECLIRDEQGALEFLWRESGLDPNTSIVNLSFSDLTAAQAKMLCEQCSAHEGLKLNLEVNKAELAAMSDLSRLILNSKVRNLTLTDLSTECTAQLAPILGRVEYMLDLYCINFDIHSEKSMGESLANSEGLKHLKLAKCDLGSSRGMQFLEGITLNRSIQTMNLVQTSIVISPRADYVDLLTKNKHLKSLNVQSGVNENVAVDSILIGALRNSSLQSLSILQWNSISIAHPENLVRLLEENNALINLDFNVIHYRLNDFPGLINALKKNTSLLNFRFGDQWTMSTADKQIIKDVLERNRALAKNDYLNKAGQAFDPNGTMANGLSDAGSAIAWHMLQNSSSLEDFADTMAVVELSMKELVQSASALGSAESLSPATRTTADTTTTTTTAYATTTATMTTTTTTLPPGLASS